MPIFRQNVNDSAHSSSVEIWSTLTTVLGVPRSVYSRRGQTPNSKIALLFSAANDCTRLFYLFVSNSVSAQFWIILYINAVFMICCIASFVIFT